MDQLFIKVTINLYPEIVYVNIYDIGIGIKILVPYIFEQSDTWEGNPLMSHEIFEQAVFFNGKVDVYVPPFGFSSIAVQYQVIACQ